MDGDKKGRMDKKGEYGERDEWKVQGVQNGLTRWGWRAYVKWK